MSVTVADLLKLPSLRQAKVLGGEKGLGKTVSSISVLESVDPGLLVHEVFPHNKYSGSEIVITGFLNCVDDVDRQCANLLRLIAGGEVGLILYYVGVYLLRVDQRLIDIANANDFVLICMPEGQRHLRYSDLITDVTECIYRDRAAKASLVSDILARISTTPHHQQTVGTALQMLCAELSCSAVLSTHEGRILNLAAWPTGTEDEIREGMEGCLPLPEGEAIPCPFLPDTELICKPIRADLPQPLQLTLIKVGTPLSIASAEQAADTVRICINIWGKQHGAVAIHELIRAILQDEPLKMRRLAEIFHVDVAALHEIWMLCGMEKAETVNLEQLLGTARQCAEIAIGAIYDGNPVMSLSTPRSLRDMERVMEEILGQMLPDNPNAVLVRCGGLSNTTKCREAYLLTLGNLEDARRIYPHKKCFLQGDLEFAASCRKRISEGEAAANRQTRPLTVLQSDREYQVLLNTACVYLLDCDGSVTKTAQMLFLHINTIKYRLQRISDLLGFRLEKMPEAIEMYRSAAIYRLLHEPHESQE